MNKKHILFFLALLSLGYTIFLITDTMAKYKSDAEANTNISIARWNILVNNQDIKNNKDFSSTITPVFEGNENMADNIIAPNAEGYFDIIVDHTNVDVSFTLKIDISIDPNSSVKDLIIKEYSYNDTNPISINNNECHINNDIDYTDTIKTRKYRFYVKWNDDEGSTMNNEEDTTATKKGNAMFKINTSFIQKAS